jgi:hypothetical protein
VINLSTFNPPLEKVEPNPRYQHFLKGGAKCFILLCYNLSTIFGSTFPKGGKGGNKIEYYCYLILDNNIIKQYYKIYY